MKITSESKGIKIEGHRGKWYVIDTTINNTIKCFLLEHETYGDEAACLIVRDDGSIIVDDVWNGFDDLPEIVYR
jgi:hypothetical protein